MAIPIKEERQIKYLSYCIRHNDKLNQFSDDHYVNKDYITIFKAIEIMHISKMPFDLDEIAQVCVREHKGDTKSKEYWSENIAKIHDTLFDFDSIDFIIKKIREDYVSEKVYENIVHKIAGEFSAKGEIKTDELLKYQYELSLLVDELSNDDDGLKEYAKHLEDYEDIAERQLKGEIPKRIIGYNCIDSHFGYRTIDAGEFIILAGFTGSGKSLFKENIETRLVNRKYPVISEVLEMNNERTLGRKLSISLNQNIDELFKDYDKAETEAEKKDIESKFRRKIHGAKRKKNLAMSFKRGIDLIELENHIVKAKRMFKRDGVIKEQTDFCYITIDLLDQLEELSNSDWGVVKKGINDFHMLLQKYNLGGICVLQAGDEVFDKGKRKPKRPEDCDFLHIDTSMLRGGQVFRERARAIFSLTRPLELKKKFFPDRMEEWECEDDDIINVQLIKSNNTKSLFKQFVLEDTGNIKEFLGD